MYVCSEKEVLAWRTHSFEQTGMHTFTCSKCGIVVPKQRDSASFQMSVVPECPGKKEDSDASPSV